MGSKVKLAVCTLNQWAIDFQGNFENIKQAIAEAHQNGAKYCLTPELSISGYGCEDHFYESDTMLHCWEILAELMKLNETKDMICDVGMPVMHKSVRYNCRVIFMFNDIILIRPKMSLCNEENFRELRWFVPWQKKKTLENCLLPYFLQKLTGRTSVPFGDAVISTSDTCIGSEVCEELWTSDSSHVSQSFNGVEIFTNASGSHFNLRKADIRVNLVQNATTKVGGVYLLCNQIGCDGGRLFYDGGSMIAINGKILVQGSSFSLKNVEVNLASIDLEDIRMYRMGHSSSCMRAAREEAYPSISLPKFSLSYQGDLENLRIDTTPPILWNFFIPEEEIEKAPACWLWDYLRKSGQSGFFLPLSGGVDSSSVACIVFSMCNMVCQEVHSGNFGVLSDLRRILSNENFECLTPETLCKLLLTTCYMASENSSATTKKRAHALAHRIGSYHIELSIDTVVNALLMVFSTFAGFIPKFKAHGGTHRENAALQNIQARVRMVLAYLFAQLVQWVRGDPGLLLVLGSSNVDESLRGYFTKYDCSSADINPIGGISKVDLKSFIVYFAEKHGIHPLREIIQAPPTAELEPLSDGQITQTDEDDMGMTYDELAMFGRIRKITKCGPYGMFSKLIHLWQHCCSPLQVAQKVKHFFFNYSINRHKMTTLTPAMHAENYSPEDNRFDLRPFLYNSKWSWQFRKIDQQASRLERPSTPDPTVE